MGHWAGRLPAFYLKNVGLVAVLAIGGLLAAKGREFSLYVPGLFLWLLAELVVFQPNEYDNNKLLYRPLPSFAARPPNAPGGCSSGCGAAAFGRGLPPGCWR